MMGKTHPDDLERLPGEMSILPSVKQLRKAMLLWFFKAVLTCRAVYSSDLRYECSFNLNFMTVSRPIVWF